MRTPVLLIIGDEVLREEIDQALRELSTSRVVVQRARDYRDGLEAARVHEPDVICAEFGTDQTSLQTRARELAEVSPGSFLVSAYSREAFRSGEEESAFLIAAVRGRIDDFIRRPAASSDMRRVLERFVGQTQGQGDAQRDSDVAVERRRRERQPGAARYRRRSTDRPGRVISFVSNKGGVGKSTLATNAACLLATRHPDEVLLIDASLQLGVCRSLLDLEPAASILDAVRERERLDSPLLMRLSGRHECGLRLLAAPLDAMEASEVDDESFTRIVNLARRTCRYVIIDTFPLIDDIVMTTLDATDLIYVVMQGTVPDVIGTASYLGVLDRLGVPREKHRVVLNRNYANFAGRLSVEDIEERLGEPLAHVFPYRKALLVAQNAGTPHALGLRSRFGFDPALRALVDEIEGEPASAGERRSG